jgi:hypothetical protein
VYGPSTVEQLPFFESENSEPLDAFASVCTWTTVYYRWRPNLVDEADHHLLELAVASGAKAIVTKDVRHLSSSELRFTQIRTLLRDAPIKALRPWLPPLTSYPTRITSS